MTIYISQYRKNNEVNSSFSWISDDLADALKFKYKDAVIFKVVSVTTGDGDEGCIYIE